jgi:hypothetical protein
VVLFHGYDFFKVVNIGYWEFVDIMIFWLLCFYLCCWLVCSISAGGFTNRTNTDEKKPQEEIKVNNQQSPKMLLSEEGFQNMHKD